MPAEGHVDDHQHADDDHRDGVFEPEQQLDELAGADHLDDQVEAHDRQRADGCEGADLRLVEPVGCDIREGKAAQVAEPLGHQEQDDRPADEEADDVDEAVEAGAEHEAGQAEQGGRRHIVAGDGEAVLEPGDAAARRVEIGGRFGAVGRPIGDAERSYDEDEEHDDGGRVDRLLFHGTQIAARREGEGRNEYGNGGAEGTGHELMHRTVHSAVSRIRSLVSSSKGPLAKYE